MTKKFEKIVKRILGLSLVLIATLVTTQPCFASEVNSEDIKSTICFTSKEQEYIDSHKDNPLVVAISTDMTPVEYYDEETSNYAGFTVELYDLVGKMTGLKFKYVARGSVEETRQAISNGSLQMVGSLANNENVASALGVIPSNPYYSITISLVSKNTWSGVGDPSDTVAVKSGYPVFENTAKSLGYSNFVEYDSFEDCVEAVNNGKADITLISTTGENVLLGHSYYSKLTTILLSQTENEYSMGIADNKDATVLLSIINKTLAAIPQEQIMQMRLQNILGVKAKQDIRDVLSDNGYLIISCILLVIIITIVALSYRIRQRRRISDLLNVKNQELNQIIAEKDEALITAAKASSAKSDFLARMSHDIRTPLNAVIGFTELALDEPDVPLSVTGYLSKISYSGKYLLSLINDILDMSKIDNGKMELNEKNIDGYKMLTSIADIFRLQAKEKNIELITDFSVGPSRWLYIDELRTRQIYSNLFSNAIKFSPSGSIITWTMKEVTANENSVSVISTVSDQGCGMTEEFMKKMFEPFEQAKPDDSSIGTGLGLSIVKNLVDLMGGKISVESKIGKGTTFTIEMEFKFGKECDEEQASEKQSIVSLKGRKILLCEDNQINILLATKLLEKRGCIIDVAENGSICVDKFNASKSGTYDAILMDIMMPVMDGYEATKTIRSIYREDAKEICIIAMSANAYEDDIKKSLECGMNAHISKPIDPKNLYETLSTQIGLRFQKNS